MRYKITLYSPAGRMCAYIENGGQALDHYISNLLRRGFAADQILIQVEPAPAPEAQS